MKAFGIHKIGELVDESKAFVFKSLLFDHPNKTRGENKKDRDGVDPSPQDEHAAILMGRLGKALKRVGGAEQAPI